MTDNKYAPTTWGQEVLRDLEMPSGQLCQIRPPGMQALIAAGVLESADTLTSLIDEKHLKRVAPTRKNAKGPQGQALKPGDVEAVDSRGLMQDPENLVKIFTLVDKVTVHMVVQPNVQPVPEPGAVREEGVIYVDMVDFLDKMYIFQYSIGSDSNLEQFRSEFASSLGSLATR